MIIMMLIIIKMIIVGTPPCRDEPVLFFCKIRLSRFCGRCCWLVFFFQTLFAVVAILKRETNFALWSSELPLFSLLYWQMILIEYHHQHHHHHKRSWSLIVAILMIIISISLLTARPTFFAYLTASSWLQWNRRWAPFEFHHHSSSPPPSLSPWSPSPSTFV